MALRTKTMFVAVFCVLLVTGVVAQGVVLNEFLAVNETVLTNNQGKTADWIELFNDGGATLDLTGWYLTDSATTLTKWAFPTSSIPPGGYLIVWASGSNAVLGSELHTSFQLNSSGEYLALVEDDGETIASAYTPAYPIQSPDVSYGQLAGGGEGYLSSPTPGSANTTGYTGVAASPLFSVPAGYYTNSQSVVLTVTNGGTIHYTLDCSDPTELSPTYGPAITVASRAGEANNFSEIRTTYYHTQAEGGPHWLGDWFGPAGEVFKATVIRARTYAPGKLPSPIVTMTYWVATNIFERYPDVPVVSLVSDSNNLFSADTGIYVPGTNYTGVPYTGNYFQDWTRQAHIELFDFNGSRVIGQNCGIKLQGATSQAAPHKGLHVLSGSEYGKEGFDFPLFWNTTFDARDIQSFRRFLLRAWGSYGARQVIPDAFAQRALAERDQDLQAYRPCIVFINGEYWGLQEIREANKNAWYTEEHHQVDHNDPGIDLLYGRGGYTPPGTSESAIDEGDSVHWAAMRTFMTTHDLSLPENYAIMETLIDIENFIEYIGHGVFAVKEDWPDQNEAKWRPRTVDGRWRWLQFDMDHAFWHNPTQNMVTQIYNGGASDILNELSVNVAFQHAFVNWFCDAMNTVFQVPVLEALLSAMKAELQPYMPEYFARWQVLNQGLWDNYTGDTADGMLNFIQDRNVNMKQHLAGKFGFSNTQALLTLDVSDPAAGVIKINSTKLIGGQAGVSEEPYPWQGSYFTTIPIRLEALAEDGYLFDHWEGDWTGTANPTSVTVAAASSVTAVFALAPPVDTNLVVTELMYHPIDDPEPGSSNLYEF
ncbi:MAG: CotH kinase family protein, partial [Verrucomicrobia bacterium]|nr:CotH kinase family protein [Verrucomicrobiota bacterium]